MMNKKMGNRKSVEATFRWARIKDADLKVGATGNYEL
jgi:hypothetical protein